jgi:hypothetical protein
VTWVKLDDGFPENSKVSALSDRAFRFHVTALCQCGKHLTDGRISTKRAAKVAQLLELRRWNTVVTQLVDARLWQTTEDGWVIKDFLQYNLSKAEVEAKREQTRERQRRHRLRLQEEEEEGHDVTNALHNVVTSQRDVTAPRPVTADEVPAFTNVSGNSTAAVETTGDGTAAAELRIILRNLKWREWQVAAGVEDPERAWAWIKRARSEAQTNPGGYAWTGFSSGDEVPLTNNGVRYTGCKWVRGSHGSAWVQDVLGTDKPPADWPYDAPTAKEIQAALAKAKPA